jgi:hypothetical protein
MFFSSSFSSVLAEANLDISSVNEACLLAGNWEDTLKSETRSEHLFDYTLAAPVSGGVGVWSKTDSIAELTDYTVTPAPKPAG